MSVILAHALTRTQRLIGDKWVHAGGNSFRSNITVDDAADPPVIIGAVNSKKVKNIVGHPLQDVPLATDVRFTFKNAGKQVIVYAWTSTKVGKFWSFGCYPTPPAIASASG